MAEIARMAAVAADVDRPIFAALLKDTARATRLLDGSRTGTGLFEWARAAGGKVDAVDALLGLARRKGAGGTAALTDAEVRGMTNLLRASQSIENGLARARKLLNNADLTRKRLGAAANVSEQELQRALQARGRTVLDLAAFKASSETLDKLDRSAIERILGKYPDPGKVKGQLFEELIEVHLRNDLTREGVVGLKAQLAAAKAKSKIEFIPGHRVLDGDGVWFTDGLLVYRDRGVYKVVGMVEGKSGKFTAPKLSRSWEGIPKPSAAVAKRWRAMSRDQIERLRKTDPKQAKSIEAWKEARAEAIERLRTRDPSLRNATSDALEKTHSRKIDAIMKELPQSEAGQLRKSMERLVPNFGKATTKIRIGTENADGTVTFATVDAVGTPATTKLVGVVPDGVSGNAIRENAKNQGLEFHLIDHLGITEAQLDDAVKAIIDAAKRIP
jgi:hypothetical protein